MPSTQEDQEKNTSSERYKTDKSFGGLKLVSLAHLLQGHLYSQEVRVHPLPPQARPSLVQVTGDRGPEQPLPVIRGNISVLHGLDPLQRLLKNNNNFDFMAT